MNPLYSIYTEKAQCQDCYRCVRGCPVKAIKIEQGNASVVDELCIHCGSCVNNCPAGAKRVRDDSRRALDLLASGAPVIASLAPSYRSEFRDIAPERIIAALRKIGFRGVSETSLGAEEVSAHVSALLAGHEPKLWISSACPTAVEYIRKYRPAIVESITPLLSPLLAHCRLLKKSFGPDTHVVFFGPCIAKKGEAAEHPDLLDVALTFEDLRAFIDRAGLPAAGEPDADNRFIPRAAAEGALYPIDGGMVASLKANCSVCDRQALHFSGLDEICAILDSVALDTAPRPLFLELLACAGGCINGPRAKNGGGTLQRRITVLENADVDPAVIPRLTTIEISNRFYSSAHPAAVYPDEEIDDLLSRTGKQSRTDELNCGSCGYGNCRDFARAVLGGKGEIAMCVTYMRQLANKKANKLIMAMPSGVVIVNTDLHIVECNRRFAELAGEEAMAIYEQRPGLGGAVLEKIFPVSHLFSHLLATGEEILDRDIRIGSRVIHATVFSIEAGAIAGGIFNDVTAPQMHREEIIQRSQSVIRNNLTTVQKIAYLLGENAAETEMVLSTIIDSYKLSGPGGGDEG